MGRWRPFSTKEVALIKNRSRWSNRTVQGVHIPYQHAKLAVPVLIILSLLSLLALVGCGSVGQSSALSSQGLETITVSAAISLKDAFKQAVTSAVPGQAILSRYGFLPQP